MLSLSHRSHHPRESQPGAAHTDTDMSHSKLTSLATTTLSLLLERQRLYSTHPALHLAQIVANLRTLRSGVTALQDASSDAGSAFGDGSRGGEDGIAALRIQYERLRGMLGEDEAEKAGLARCVLIDDL